MVVLTALGHCGFHIEHEGYVVLVSEEYLEIKLTAHSFQNNLSAILFNTDRSFSTKC